MFAGVARNVAISAAAFFAVSVVGLLLVPVLISTYGLTGFGQITLARLFVPLAALALLDIGFGEIAMLSVAGARVDKDWTRCARMLCLDGSAALLMGLAIGALLWLSASHVPVWTDAPMGDRPSLAFVLRVTAVLLPLFFASLVFEGVLKGYENFAMQRMVEVVSSLAYAAMTLLAVHLGFGFDMVCLAFLASLVLRTGLAAFLALRLLARDGAHLLPWGRDDRVWFGGRARVLHHSKVLGAVQANGPSLVISVLIGPAGLAIYEALSRMPRFAKAVLGLLNSTVQPLAVRLESEFQGDGMARFGRLGLLMVAMITVPVLGAAVALSEPILRLWLGPSMAVMWPWQAMYFVVPALGALVGFGGSALLARGNAMASMNRITVIYLAIVLLVGLAGASLFGERAFVASQVLAAIVTFPINMRLIRKEMRVDAATFGGLAKIFVVILALVVPTLLLASKISSVPVLIVCIAAWVATGWLASVALALDVRYQRRLLGELRQPWNRWRGR